MRTIAVFTASLVAWLCVPCLAAPAGKAARGVKGIQTPGIQVAMGDLKPEATLELPGPVQAMTFDQALYVSTQPNHQLLRVDPKSGATEILQGVQSTCGALAAAFDSLWVPNCAGHTLTRIGLKTNQPVASIDLSVADVAHAVAASPDSIWLLSDERSTLVRLDPETNLAVAELRLPAGCNSVTFGESALWVTCPSQDKLLRIDPKTNLVTNRIELPKTPSASVVSDGSVWVLCHAEGKVARIDSKTSKISAIIPLNIPGQHGTISAGEGYIWVSTEGFPVSRIDPATDTVAQQFTGEQGDILVSGAGSVWLASTGTNKLLRLDPKRMKTILAP